MRQILLIFLTLFLCRSVNSQSQFPCPTGYNCQLLYHSAGAGNAYKFSPAVDIRAMVQQKAQLGTQKIGWYVEAYFHHYRTITFIKHLELKNGKFITETAVLYDVKKGQKLHGGGFGGDVALGNDLFAEDCPGEQKVAKVWVTDISCVLADDDAIIVQEKERLARIGKPTEVKQIPLTETISTIPPINGHTSGNPTMMSITIATSSSTTTSGTQKQQETAQRQADANEYLSKAQTSANSPVTQQLNYNLAANSAIAAGNTQQAVKIQQQAAAANQQNITNAIDHISNMFAQQSERKQAAAQQKAEREEKLKAERVEFENRMAEEKRTEAERIGSNKTYNSELNKRIGGEYSDIPIRKPYEMVDTSVNVIYYVVWSRLYSNLNPGLDGNEVLISNPVAVQKNENGSWPLYEQTFKKICEKLLVASSSAMENKAFVIGFFTSIPMAEKAISNLVNNARLQGIGSKIVRLYQFEVKQPNNAADNFWKN